MQKAYKQKKNRDTRTEKLQQKENNERRKEQQSKAEKSENSCSYHAHVWSVDHNKSNSENDETYCWDFTWRWFLMRLSGTDNADSGGPEQWQKEGAPYIDVDRWRRMNIPDRRFPIYEVASIAIHYTATGQTAIKQHRTTNLATTHDTKVSSHFVVGWWEVVQCIPTLRCPMRQPHNRYFVHRVLSSDEMGNSMRQLYDSAVKLCVVAWFGFHIRERTGIMMLPKNCPKYYVENWMHGYRWTDIAVQIDVDYGLQDVQ